MVIKCLAMLLYMCYIISNLDNIDINSYIFFGSHAWIELYPCSSCNGGKINLSSFIWWGIKNPWDSFSKRLNCLY
jgi:hypothetical protein